MYTEKHFNDIKHKPFKILTIKENFEPDSKKYIKVTKVINH